MTFHWQRGNSKECGRRPPGALPAVGQEPECAIRAAAADVPAAAFRRRIGLHAVSASRGHGAAFALPERAAPALETRREGPCSARF